MRGKLFTNDPAFLFSLVGLPLSLTFKYECNGKIVFRNLQRAPIEREHMYDPDVLYETTLM